MDFTGRPNCDDCDREDVSWFKELELRFRLFPPRALNVWNLLPSSAATAELPLADGLQLLEKLPVAVDDAKFRMSLHWRLPIASSACVAIAQPDVIWPTLSLLEAIFVVSLTRNALVDQIKSQFMTI